MWDNFVREMMRAANEIVNGFARFLPRFLEMLVIVLRGMVDRVCAEGSTPKRPEAHSI